TRAELEGLAAALICADAIAKAKAKEKLASFDEDGRRAAEAAKRKAAEDAAMAAAAAELEAEKIRREKLAKQNPIAALVPVA
ncbi:MAG TPA: hypothetical protein PKW21_15155, partial [Rhabdaerophilum sp.]|nr:hypothetical protein [Rhabdaerophilum sp.]